MARTFDEAELLERVDNDVAFLAETVQMLASDAPALLGQLRTALAAGDAPGVGRAAHAVKGMVSNFCAADAQAAALAVEKLGKSGDLAPVPAAVESLGRLVQELSDELAQFIQARS